MKIKDQKLFRQECYINGKWISSKETISVLNPSKGTLVGEIPRLGKREAEQAVSAAKNAMPDWKAKTAKERSQILRLWYELIYEHIDDLAAILTTEQGKPLEEARKEILYGASYIEWFSEEAKRVYGDIIPSAVPKQHLMVIKQPVGVVAAITPWNFPSAMITRKFAPALAAGCTFIVKPSELTPFSAFALAELAERAGVPAGVFNVITGDSDAIGKELTKNGDVRKVSFTGSTQVGKMLLEQCASTVKKVTLELGGSAPVLVFDDCDIDTAVRGLIAAKFRNTGQSCIAADRVFVQKTIYQPFVEALHQAVKELKVGDGFEKGVQVGPLINEQATQKVQRHVDDAKSKGAKILCGAKLHALGKTFYEPTILSGVKSGMQVLQEESFGPILPLVSFETEEEVIELANDTNYGLASYLFTRDIDRFWRISEALAFGMVSVNEGVFSNEVAPFGGIKESGLGREGSKYGIDEYLELKYICISANV